MLHKANTGGAARYLGALLTACGLLLSAVGARAADVPQQPAPKAAPVLKLLTAHNPPFTFKSQQTGAAAGAAVDLVRMLMDRAHISYSLAVLPWNRAYQRVLSEPDTCVFVANRLPEREKLFTWVGPLFRGGWALYRRPGSSLEVGAISDLKGLAISGTFTPEQSEFVKNVYHAVPLQVDDDLAAARLLYNGRADLWLSGVLRHAAIVKKLGAKPVEEVFVLARADLYMACHTGMDASLVTRLNTLSANLGTARTDILDRYSFDTKPAASGTASDKN